MNCVWPIAPAQEPPMAAGVTDKLWEMADLVAIVEAADAKPSRPTSYRKKATT